MKTPKISWFRCLNRVQVKGKIKFYTEWAEDTEDIFKKKKKMSKNEKLIYYIFT